MPWVRLLRSDDVATSAVVAALLGSEEVVVWRDVDGCAHVHEARCPHQFNHLAAVGGVDDRELVCAAHFWRFTATGEGFRRLADGTCEAMRNLRTYPSVEREGWVEVELPAAPGD